MKRLYIVSLLGIMLLSFLPCTQAQQKFRRGILLHHSTGGVIYGLEGAPVSIEQQIPIYNSTHGLAGSDSVSCDEESFPVNYDNRWPCWERVWNNDYSDDLPTRFLDTYPVIIFKSCFTGSDIADVGAPSDTQGITQTMYNYKWSWRNVLGVLQSHPDHFFAIWDGAPYCHNCGSSDASARRAQHFYDWVMDTLYTGKDSFGKFPRNVMVWDYFHMTDSGSTGYAKAVYTNAGDGDSHPSDAAAAMAAPKFVREIFGAAIAYEGTMSAGNERSSVPTELRLDQNYPNPFNPSTTIGYSLPYSGEASITVYNTLGQNIAEILHRYVDAGSFKTEWNAGNLPGGVYFYRLRLSPDASSGRNFGPLSLTKKLLLLK